MSMTHFRMTKTGREPSREYICPDCGVRFVARNVRNGKTCPNGHWRSIYHITYFDMYGRLPKKRVPREVAPKAEKPVKPPRQALADLGIARRGEQCELALRWWLSNYERLVGMLPDSTSKVLVTGAFDKTYQISRLLVK